MKNFIVFMLLSAVGAVALQAQAGPAPKDPTQTVCTLADMKGDFATQPEGILTVGPFAGPFSATGVIHFDGAGHFTGIATSSFYGHVIYPFHADGVYTITPNCFFSLVEETLHIGFEGFLSTSKNEVQMMEPDSGTITTNTLRRLVGLACTNASLNGNWVLNGTGTDITNGNHTAQVERLTFDGKGNMTGTTFTSVQGALGNVTKTGTYTVNTDCTILGRETDSLGNVTHWFAVLFNNGEQLIYNYSDDGHVFAGQGRSSLN